ncbi:MAG: hypothetical protein MZV65_28910 [Chromatiales bacterium]|nr:hypothetical protein [Chromatiales bacterium]
MRHGPQTHNFMSFVKNFAQEQQEHGTTKAAYVFTSRPANTLKCFGPSTGKLHSASSLDEVKKLIEIYPFHIGLALFSSDDKAILADLLGLFSIRHNMEMAALLPPELMQRQDIWPGSSPAFSTTITHSWWILTGCRSPWAMPMAWPTSCGR